ncbi:MAG: hypothetical protein GY769_03145 [bacterium]|nr:hypothetical protein [bacterium]
MKRRIAICVLVGALAGLFLYKLRGFFPVHAFLVGLAITALAYSLLRAIDNLRGASRYGSPRDQEERRDE